MPHHKAQKKSLKQDARRKVRNHAAKSALRTIEKKYRAEVATGSNPAGMLKQVQSDFDQAASKGIITPNYAARKKSRLAALLAKSATPQS